MHTILLEKRWEIQRHITSELDKDNIDISEIPEFLKKSVCRYILFLIAQYLHIQLLDESSHLLKEEELFQRFEWFMLKSMKEQQKYAQNGIMSFSRAQVQAQVFQHALSDFSNNNADVFTEPEQLMRLWNYFLFPFHNSQNVLVNAALVDYDAFSQEDCQKVSGIVFFETIDNMCAGFASTYGIVSWIAKSFTTHAKFQELNLEDRKSMFYSIKWDLLSQAMYWSKKFVRAERGGDSLITPPKWSSELLEDTLVFNFEEQKIFIDWTKQLEKPQESGNTHRTCLASHITTDGVSGSLTSNEVDMALQLYWVHYVSKV